MNSVNLIGRLVKNPELKTTQSNISVVSFTLAVDRQFVNADGERQADFINITAWRKTAELIAQFFKKGSQIGISGKLEQRSYEVDGQTRYVVEVIADRITFLDKKQETENEEQSKNVVEKDDFYEDNTTTYIVEDDLPF